MKTESNDVPYPAVKQQRADGEEGPLVPLGQDSPGVKDELQDKGADGCLGCHRQPGGRSFYVAGEPLEWAFHEGRGKWCRDCYNCWRVQYSLTHTLELFGQWLKMSRNFKEWQVALVAYLSLKFEKCSQIRKKSLQKRIKNDQVARPLVRFLIGANRHLPFDDAKQNHSCVQLRLCDKWGQ